MDEQNMKAVLRQTGLTADNLRAWEKRYGAVRPKRSPSGRRVYSAADVQRLGLLAELVRLGHAIGKIAQLRDDRLVALLNQSRRGIETRGFLEPGSEPQKNLDLLMAAVAAFDLSNVRVSLARIRFSISPRTFVFELIPQIMYLLGKSVDEGEVSISQEHAASEIIQSHLRQIYDSLYPEGQGTKKVKSLIFCTREGDPHDFGIMMAAIACRYRGFKTHYIGKSLPATSLVEAVKRIKPFAVVLGLSALPPDHEKISPTNYLTAIDEELRSETEIWLGGTAAREIRRPSEHRDFWIFESIPDLESKLRSMQTLQ